jgi:hypothetical protein
MGRKRTLTAPQIVAPAEIAASWLQPALLPRETAADFAELEAALRRDLQPRGPLEELVLRDLIALERERNRIERRIAGVWRQRAARELELAVIEQDAAPDLEAARRLARAWTQGTPPESTAADAQLRARRIDPDIILGQAWLGVREAIALDEEVLRRIPLRRSQLLEDLKRLRRLRPQAVEDAEVMCHGE